MNIRSLFLSLVALAVPVAPLAAAQPVRLFEIFVERVIKDDSGTPIFDVGRLSAQGVFTHNIYAQIANPDRVPPEVLNLNLLPISMWPAYDALGSDALANFSLDHATVTFNGQSYFVVTVSPQAKLDVGNLLNISTRGTLTPGGDPLIGGFVVDEHPRRVLIRGVGPTLGSLGVAAPLANPVLTVFRQGESASLAANDDWGQQANLTEIETAAIAVGAFALPRSSKDAALLIELPPGVYTAQLSSGNATGGTALIEIYILP